MKYAENCCRGGIVSVRGLHKAFGGTAVLDGIDLDVAEGTVLALLGPNGAGKTTTVRILATLLRPDRGTARIAGHDVVDDAPAVRALISLTGQYAAVDEEQTGRENLRMIGQLLHLGRAAARRRADELLDRFDLADAGSRRVSTYSGGMRRRLDLAMSVVGSPRVLFLDEPTTGLDPTSRSMMWSVVRDLVGDGTTVILTTQYLEEADQLADRVVLIDDGRVAADGTTVDLKRQVGGERIDVRFALHDDAVVAAALLARRGALVSADGLGIGLPTDGSAKGVHDALSVLLDAGVHPITLDLRRPTLDDVFVAVTGSAA
jgi:ABC-2 type transport system ATP-binding protein